MTSVFYSGNIHSALSFRGWHRPAMDARCDIYSHFLFFPIVIVIVIDQVSFLDRNGMVLSGTNWTPDIVESWLFRNCWPMGYHNFDSGRKAVMRTRILHAIELLSNWSSAVQPPEKTISAHDAMGGGDVMGGGEHGGKNGWSYSFGKWPNQVQPQQPVQASSVQFPIPPSVQPPPPVNVRDWVKNDDPPPRESPPSPRSRQSSTGKHREIFIPPVPDWINPNHAPASFRPRSRNPTPDPVDNGWYPESNNNFHSGSRGPRADPYSLESFDRSINSMLHQSHHRNANLVIPSNTHPVIPISIARKQNEKRRKKDRERERQSKWVPLHGHRDSDSDTSDSSDEDEQPSSSSIRRMPTWFPPSTTTHHHQQQPQPPQIRIAAPPAPPMHPQNRSHSQQDPPTRPNLTSPGPAGVSVPPHQMSVPAGTNSRMPIGLHSPPQSFGPAELAQYQFEQQSKVYQFQQQQRHQHQQQQQQYQQQQQQHAWNNAGVAVYR